MTSSVKSISFNVLYQFLYVRKLKLNSKSKKNLKAIKIYMIFNSEILAHTREASVILHLNTII